MKYKLIELDFNIPSHEIFESIKENDWAVFLNSNHEKYPDQRFDIITSNPIKKIIFKDASVLLVENENFTKELDTCPFDLLREIMSNYKREPVDDIPFCGGAIGHIAYDYGKELHQIKSLNKSLNFPSFAFGIYDWAVIYDYHKKKAFIIYHENNAVIKNISNYSPKEKKSNSKDSFKITSSCESNMNYALYEMKLMKILEYIKAGDCYQVNLAQRFSLAYEGDEYNLYQQLNKTFSSPYSVYFNSHNGKILSFSPERFLSIKNNIIETKPIKGTRPRSDNPIIDKNNIDDLKSSEKDMAENLMIVDLLRNDLSINCKKGTVKVDKLFEIETFANVHHLVSTITGEIDESSNIYNLIRDAFPGGSITGAPKLRAMEIIEELEPDERSIYCGSIGYISFDEKTDLNISIRSMLSINNNLYFWGGGGIVYDSDIRSEYNETISKVKPLLDAFSD